MVSGGQCCCYTVQWETFEGENFRGSVKGTISQIKLSQNAKTYHTLQVGMACPNFVEKTFAGGSKTAKFVKVFSLECFPLYGICICMCIAIGSTVECSVTALAPCFNLLARPWQYIASKNGVKPEHILYSRKYWRELNLAVQYGITIRIYESKKYWRILIWRLQRQTSKPPNLIPHQIFQLYGNFFCARFIEKLWQILFVIQETLGTLQQSLCYKIIQLVVGLLSCI